MKSKKMLDSFTAYCTKHPEERFWQALRNWLGKQYILVCDGQSWFDSDFGLQDTFYWEENP